MDVNEKLYKSYQPKTKENTRFDYPVPDQAKEEPKQQNQIEPEETPPC